MVKNNLFLILVFFLINVKLFSESKFSHPLRTEPASVYSKIRVNLQATENRERNFYEREQNLGLEGEYKFGQYFSINGFLGGRNYEVSGSKSQRGMERYGFGLKFAREHGDSNFRFSYSGGLKGYSKQSMTYSRSETSNDLFLVKPNIAFGLGIQKFELVLDASLQTETNSRFNEDDRQDFRRHYTYSASMSYGLGDSFRLFLESEYREPYNKKIDTKIRSMYVFPGFSYKIYDSGVLALSGQFQLLTENYSWDRGARLSYFHFFE
ncbi:MAG: hypothetical protein SFU98_22965 [Leptospiraceae bacterium]|nr:hypothetical protein [Leptospiraceae bacterium]